MEIDRRGLVALGLILLLLGGGVGGLVGFTVAGPTVNSLIGGDLHLTGQVHSSDVVTDSLTDTGLSSGRIPVVGAGGLLGSSTQAQADAFTYPESEASYIVWTSNATGTPWYYAKNGHTGNIDYSGADAATVIQAAINALTSGGVISLGKGQFTLNAQISSQSRNNITLEGMGTGTVIKAGVNLNKDMIKLQSVSHWTLRNFEIDGNKANQAGPIEDLFMSNIFVETCDHIKIENIYTHHGYNYGITISKGTQYFEVIGCTADNNGDMIHGGDDGIQVTAYDYHNAIQSAQCRWGVIAHCFAAGNAENGIEIETSSEIEVHDCITQDNHGISGIEVDGDIAFAYCSGINIHDNIMISDKFGQRIEYAIYSQFNNNYIINANTTGYYILHTYYCDFNGNKIVGAVTEDGYLISDSYSIKLLGGSIKSCARYGVYVLDSTERITIDDVEIVACVARGIHFGSSDVHSKIISCDIHDNTLVGIYVGAGVGELFIEGNVLEGNANPQIDDDGVGTVIKNNLGFVTENRVSATITAAATSIVVAHGCSYTPAAGDIHATLTNLPTTPIGDIYVDTIGAVNFTLHSTTPPGAATAIFDVSITKTP